MANWDNGLTDAVVAASAAASETSRWRDVITILARRFGATAAAVHTPRADPCQVLRVETGLPAGSLAQYAAHWADQDPWWAHADVSGSALRSGYCGIGRELCDWPQLDRSDFYNGMAKPIGVRGLLGLVVDDGHRAAEAPLTVICLYRRPGLEEFSRDDQRAFRSIHAPLQLALHSHWALADARRGRCMAADALSAVPKAIFVLSATGALLHANPTGAQLIASGNRWLTTRFGAVTAIGDMKNEDFLHLLQRCACGTTEAHSLWHADPPAQGGGVRTAVAKFVPIAPDNACRDAWPRASVLLLIDEPARDVAAQRLDAFRRRYGLTPAEAGVLAQLATGHTLANIARASDTSIHTVRTHLQHLFDKTGARRQSELVRLCASCGFSPPP